MQHVAVRQVGDKGAGALAKTDQHLALLGDVFDPQSRLAPIAPGLIVEQRRQHLRHLDLADVLHVIEQHALLGLDLGVRVHVLQAAAAADGVVLAARFDALFRGFQHRGTQALVVAALALGVAKHHFLAGQRALDEGGLVVDARDTAAIVTHRLDAGFELAFRQTWATAATGHLGLFQVARKSA